MKLDRSTQLKLLGQYSQLCVGNSVFLTNSSSLPQAHQQQPGCCFPACRCLMLSPCKDSTRSLITMMYVSVLGCIVIDDDKFNHRWALLFYSLELLYDS